MTATLDKPDAIEIPDEIEPASAAPLVKFSIDDHWIAKAKARYDALIALPTIPEDDLRRELTTLVRARTAIDDERLKQGELARQHIADVNGKAKQVTGRLAPLESDLQKRWDAIAEVKAKAKREAEAARQKAIQDKIDADNAARKAELDREAAELKAAQDALAESKRKLDEQQAEIKAKADAEAAADRAREEKARQERQKKEDEEREAQRQKDEAERKAAKARQDAIDAEQRARQAELDRKQKEIDDAAAAVKAAKEKADLEEFQRQAAIKAEADAKAKAEADRIAAEEAAVKERGRLAELKRREEALKPDKAKLAEFADRLRNIPLPKVAEDEAHSVLVEVYREICDVADRLDSYVNDEMTMPYKVIA